MNTKKETLTLPESLEKGDTIGIVAPAGAFDKKKFQLGIGIVEGMGFNIHVPEDIFRKDSYLAGSDPHRADLINRLFGDPDIKAVMCARGGFGSMRILDLLDYTTIRKNPKIFVGFSDITAILSVLYSKCKITSLHGPMVTTLVDSDQSTRDSLFYAMSSGAKLKISPQSGETIKSGVGVGPVFAGNLTTICHLIGTPFEVNLKGHILLLEDVDEAPYRIDRMLIQMRLSGCFEGLEGLAIGSFERCGDLENIHRIFARIFRGDNIPILAGFDIGHGTRNITLPVGLTATLDADDHFLLFHDPATAPGKNHNE